MGSICKESFYEFVKEFWDTIVPEKPVWNWHIHYICKELQYIAELVFGDKVKEYDEIINVSPGSTKSTLASIMYLPWIWSRMPSARFIGGSYAKDLSMDLSRRSRDIVKSEKYQDTFTYVRLRRDQDVKSYFANNEGGGRFATSTGGAVTGFHAHFIVIDDPLDPNAALSDVELENANNWINETLSQRKVDKAKTPTVLIMQRLHQNDPSANMMKIAKEAQQISIREGRVNAPLKVKHVCLPAEITENVKPKSLRKYYEKAGGLMDPIRLPREVLNDNMARGAYLYSGQFLQNPVPLGGGMFKTDRIIIEELAPRDWYMRVRYWDKAGTPGGGAWSVGLEMGLTKKDYLNGGGQFWILNVQRGQWGSNVREVRIKQTAEMDGKIIIVGLEQEPGSAGKESVENTIHRLAGWRVRADRPTGDKIIRADPFSVQVNNRNVYMVKADWNQAYIDELQFFPRSTYKDQVDASSGAFKILTKGKRIVGAMRRRTPGVRRFRR